MGVNRKFVENEYNPTEEFIIPNKEAVRQKIAKLKSDGAKNIQIITDFDQTITPFTHKGQPCEACFSVFQTGASEHFKTEQTKYFHFFAPKEKDPNLTREEKVKFMEQWWQKEEEMFLEEKFTKERVKDALEKTNIGFRYGFHNFITYCESLKIPFYVVSGGIIDLIGTILRQTIPDLETNDSIEIYSNVMIWDKNDVCVGFERPHIHTLHKEYILDKNNPDFKFKKNAILLGDSINDALMAKRVECDTLLTIAFLNPNSKDRIQEYSEQYDIVIFGEGNFTQIEGLLRHIVGHEQTDEIQKIYGENKENSLASLF